MNPWLETLCDAIRNGQFDGGISIMPLSDIDSSCAEVRTAIRERLKLLNRPNGAKRLVLRKSSNKLLQSVRFVDP